MKRTLILKLKSTMPPGAWEGLKKIINKLLLFTRMDLLFYYDSAGARGALNSKALVEGLCREIMESFNPGSIIDFGCGIGTMLWYFKNAGKEILGIDGSRSNRKYSIINKKDYLLFDLRRRIDTGRVYDLCLCLEVAEHIEEKYSDVLIDNLVRSSPCIIFSSAPPDQTGDSHFNLKPYEWWIGKFKNAGYTHDFTASDSLKNRIKKIADTPQHYIDNIMVFRSNSSGA